MKIEKQYVEYGFDGMVDNKAFEVELKEKKVLKGAEDFYKLYNTNSDKKLDETELAEVMLDIEEADTDGDGVLSNKELNSIIKKRTGKKATSKTRKNFEKFLNTIQKNYMNTIKNNADGKIDYSEQGATGDCWFLAQANSLATTEWGADAIKNAIKKNDDGSYTVTFSGVKDLDGNPFKATYTKEEIKAAQKEEHPSTKGTPRYSVGDLDMLLLELTTEKYIKQEMENSGLIRKDPENPLRTGYGSGKVSLQYMLTGKTGNQFTFRDEIVGKKVNTSKMSDVSKSMWAQVQDTTFNSTIGKEAGMKKILTQVAKNKDKYSVGCCMKELSGYKVGHEYTIKDVKLNDKGDIEEIVMINPWGNNRIKTYTWEEFLKGASVIDVTSESDTYDEFKEGFEPTPVRV